MVGMGNERDVDVAYIGDSKRDDAVVVQVDTGERTKRLRVVLNERVIWDGDPEAEKDDGLAAEMAEIRNKFSHTEVDTIDRVRVRMGLIFDAFYDDEEGEPDQAIRDALTDLLHISADRGIDLEAAIVSATDMFNQEREEWGVDE